MEEKSEELVNVEVIREMKNDFTFFIAMSMLKTMALSAPDPKTYIKDVIWKWRESQVAMMGALISEAHNRMLSDPLLSNLFGELIGSINKEQRESIIKNIRLFSDTLEKALTSTLGEEGGDSKEKEGFFE